MEVEHWVFIKILDDIMGPVPHPSISIFFSVMMVAQSWKTILFRTTSKSPVCWGALDGTLKWYEEIAYES